MSNEHINEDEFLESLKVLLGPAEEAAPGKAPRKEALPDIAALKKESIPRKSVSKKSEEKPMHMNYQKLLIGALCCFLILALFIGSYFSFRYFADPYGNKIMDGVSVGGIDLSGLSKSEAKHSLQEAFEDFSAADMEICFPDQTVKLTPQETGAKLIISRAVSDAYAIGRSATDDSAALELLPYLEINTDYIRQTIDEYAASFSLKYIPSKYEVVGTMPALNAELFDENAPCQTLELTIGSSGYILDTETIFNEVIDSYNHHSFSVSPSCTAKEIIPEKLNLEAIHNALLIEAIEPEVNLETYGIVPGVHGYQFNLDQAQEKLAHANYGDTLSIPMEYISPSIADEDAYFQDLLGSCETPHGNNENRNNNLRLACSFINDFILQPGETFSYNKVVGERSEARGFLPAPAYSGTVLVDSPGGGVCQVSSTTYLASVYAEMTILERVNHGYPVNYIPLGMDATVNYGITDLKLRNDTNFPVKYKAWEADGVVHVEVWGTEVRDYDIEMTYSVGGRYVKTFMRKYTKDTHELISKTEVALSAYLDEIY